jgi:hypothetical protein
MSSKRFFAQALKPAAQLNPNSRRSSHVPSH